MTEEFLKGQVLDQIGDPGRDASWELSLPLSTFGGYMTISFCGHETQPINYPATREVVQNALFQLPSIGTNNIEVIGVPGGPYRLFARGSIGKQFLPMQDFPFLADGSNLTEPSALIVTPLDAGRSQKLKSKLDTLWEANGAYIDINLRALICKRALFIDLLAEARKLIDTTTNERKETASQAFKQLESMNALNEAAIRGTNGGNAYASGLPTNLIGVGRIQKRTSNGARYGEMVYDEEIGEYY